MNSIRTFEKIIILLVTFALISSFYLIAIVSLWLITRIKINLFQYLFSFVGLFIAAFISSCLALLLIDNFTYTVFRFGIVTSSGIFRFVYILIFLGLLFLSLKEIYNVVGKTNKIISKIKKKLLVPVATSLVIVLLFVSVITIAGNEQERQNSALSAFEGKKPNIFLITADGVNAKFMSLYGYQKDTTPFLKQMAESSLVGQNAFTNSGNTSGSIISILTGKYPIETHVLYPPDILEGKDTYQHLPGILKLNGYYSAQFTFSHYVDAYQLNIKNGFDEANGRAYHSAWLNRATSFLPTNIGYFSYELGNRLIDRLNHIFYIREMTNPYQEMKAPEYFDDQQKIDKLINILENTDKPVFAQIHWMGTHGERFFPSEQVFSAGKDPNLQTDWEKDFYLDAILEFDQAISHFYHELEIRGLLDQSIIIIASDHGQHYLTDKRLPLLIRFPNGEYHKKITANVQNLDISPTILDYMGMPQPEWMKGSSLLKEVPQNRPIFAYSIGNVEVEDGSMRLTTVTPPFYQFGYASMIICNTWYEINLGEISMVKNGINGVSGNCNQNISRENAIDLITEQLELYQYDVSSIELNKPNLIE
jgi:arylsulfatase A-like enzyme